MKRLAMAKVRQHFQRPCVEDVPAEIERQMQRLRAIVRPGMSIAITAGSRGINGITTILSAVVRTLRSFGAEPFIFAAMGSHGGGTTSGQLNILHHLGITEEAVGAPLRITSKAVDVGVTASGHVLYCDAEAAKSDAVFIVNRVKPHTAFRDKIASGLFKMLTVGMGKVPGAMQVHQLGSLSIYQAIVDMARLSLEKLPVIGGLAIVENGLDETAHIELLLSQEMEQADERLLTYAWELLPSLPLKELDILIVEEIGKNFSGTGMDTNVVGRWKDVDIKGPISPRIKRIVVLRLSAASEGNANGIGLADFTTQKLVEAIDWKATLMNVRTTGFWGRAFCPPFPGSDQDAIQWAIESMKLPADHQISAARIKNTLHIEELWLNKTALLSAAQKCEQVGSFEPLSFNAEGDLLNN